jgi:predicted nucleic acid-binding protein
MIVTETSVVFEVLLRSPRAPVIEKRIFSANESLHAPHLLDVEVVQVLRRKLVN